MRLIGISLIILLFAILGIIFSYPLILNFNSEIPYAYAPPVYGEAHLVPGDHLSLYYIYWLLKDYFITKGQNLFREPYMFYIPGWPRPYEPRGLPSSVLFLISFLSGNVSAYNIIITLSFILSGVFTYILAKKYLKHTGAAIISGTIYAISPFRLTQLFGGHPVGLILFWIPIIVYLYELLWEKRKFIYGWLAGIFIFFMCMEEHHMGYYTALFTVVYLGYKYYKTKKLNIIQLFILSIPVLTGWTVSLGYMMYVKYLVFSASISSGGRTFNEIKLFSPDIKHIFQRINSDAEKCIYIGISVFFLCLLGLLKRCFSTVRQKKYKDSFPYIFYFLTFITSLLLSLGPNLKYFPIYKICYKLIPFFHFPRATARIFMFTLLSSSLLAGYGVKVLIDLFRKKWLMYIAIPATILFLVIDFHTYPEIGLSKLSKGNKTYEIIKNSFPKNPLLEIPIWPGESSWSTIYQYYTTIYRIPLVNGYSAFVTKQYVDEIFWQLVSINMGMINSSQYELLKKLDIKYINLHEEAYPQKVNPFPFIVALENLKKSPFIEFVLQDGPMYLFKILDKPSGRPLNKYTITSKTGVFYECENMPHRIGEVIEEKIASGDKSLYADTNVTEPQHLIFGPWQLFPPGRYKIIFRLKLEGGKTQENIATIEVTTDNGNKRIIHKDLTGMDSTDYYKDYELDFTLDELTVLEFRIIYYGTGKINADYVYLLCKEATDPVWFYEAEELFHIGREKDDAVYATPEIDPKGYLVFGSYRRYPEGKYRIGFKIKAEKELEEASVILKIVSGHSEKPFAEMELKNIPTTYNTYWLEVTLDKPTVLELLVEFLKKVPIYADSIRIEPTSTP